MTPAATQPTLAVPAPAKPTAPTTAAPASVPATTPTASAAPVAQPSDTVSDGGGRSPRSPPWLLRCRRTTIWSVRRCTAPTRWLCGARAHLLRAMSNSTMPPTISAALTGPRTAVPLPDTASCTAMTERATPAASASSAIRRADVRCLSSIAIDSTTDECRCPPPQRGRRTPKRLQGVLFPTMTAQPASAAGVGVTYSYHRVRTGCRCGRISSRNPGRGVPSRPASAHSRPRSSTGPIAPEVPPKPLRHWGRHDCPRPGRW